MKCFSLNLNVFKDLHFFRDDSKEFHVLERIRIKST